MQGSTEGTAMVLALCGMVGADRPAEAEGHADKIIDLARATGSITMFSLGSSIRALIRWRRGHLAGAEADGSALIAVESHPGVEVVRLVALAAIVIRTSALLHSGPERIEMLRGAVDHLPRERAAVERTHALVELGAALRRAGYRTEAREPVQGPSSSAATTVP